MKRAMPTSHLLVLFVTSAAWVVGCSAASPEAIDEERVASQSDAITKGAPDKTHHAVMLQTCDEGCFCTGTLVKKDEALGIGWIVTSASCVPDPDSKNRVRFYVQGNKAATFHSPLVNTIEPGALRYPVLDAVRHPKYQPSSVLSLDGKATHDVGVIRILGVGAETPVMALGLASDELDVGSSVVDIGYGSTGYWYDETDLGDAGTRHSARVKVSALSATHVSVSGNESGGAVNLGDMGGPVVALVGSAERVVGVHSGGIENGITSVRQSARVSSELGWLDEQLAKAPPADGCNACLKVATGGVRACANTNLACLDDPDCDSYSLCIDRCATPLTVGPTKECRDRCKMDHVQGTSLYEAAFACGCQACASACGDVCPSHPAEPIPKAAPETDPRLEASGRRGGNATGSGCVTSRRSASSSSASLLAVGAALAFALRRRRAESA